MIGFWNEREYWVGLFLDYLEKSASECFDQLLDRQPSVLENMMGGFNLCGSQVPHL